MRSYRCCKYPTATALSIKRLAPILQIIGEESRLRILSFLTRNKHCVCELTDHTKYSQSLISHHLKDLKKYGVVIDEKIGLRVYYSLTPWGKSIINSLLGIKSRKAIT